MTSRRKAVVAALFSWVSMWTLIGISVAGVLLLWWQWSGSWPRSVPMIPVFATFTVCMATAYLLERRHREAARAVEIVRPDPRIVIPVRCQYHGVITGMHTWIAVEPLSIHDLTSVRLAVSMCTPVGPGHNEPLDVVVHAVR